MPNYPWHVFPALTRERLLAVYDVVHPIYAAAMADHRPESGDGPVTRGTRLWERTCSKLQGLNGQLGIGITNENNECLIHMDDAPPIKFGYDNPQAPKRRRLRVSAMENVSLQGHLFGGPKAAGRAVRGAPKAVLRLMIAPRRGRVMVMLGLYSTTGSTSPLLAWNFEEFVQKPTVQKLRTAVARPVASQPPVQVTMKQTNERKASGG